MILTVLTSVSELFGSTLGGLASGIVQFAINAAFALLVYLVGARIINWFAKRFRRFLLNKKDFDNSALTFFETLFSVVLKIFLAIACLVPLGLTQATILAALGTIGVGVGLALQGGVANLAGGVLILLVKPFVDGDYIIEATNQYEGTVKKIDIFYTTLLTYDNKKIIIPNKNLTSNSIINLTSEGSRILDLRFCIEYTDDIVKTERLLKEIGEADPATIQEKPVAVFVDALSDNGVVIALRIWTHVQDFFPAKWRLTEEIKLAFDREGIHFAFPKVDVHLDQIDKKEGEQKC